MSESLTERYRPKTLSDIVGQEHLTGASGRITRMLATNRLQSCIFYGPPGCGKTTVARILATTAGLPFRMLNSTNATLSDVREAASLAVTNDNGTKTPALLYLDEIQYFNKKQQQSLLPYIEDGDIILIASTADNPYYVCYDALRSRCTILEFKPVPLDDVSTHIADIAKREDIALEQEAAAYIGATSSGDLRKALLLLESAILQHPEAKVPVQHAITAQDVAALMPSINMSGFDTDADHHYNLKSGLQKSIRGSDPNAALFYLASLLEGGDILSVCRRLMVIANEDIGMADPLAIPLTYACVEMAKMLGMPEANKPLTNAVLYLATANKSSAAEISYGKAAEDVHNGLGNVVPKHLRHACAPGYVWPHRFPGHWCEQQYMPDDIRGHIYYVPEENPVEQERAHAFAQRVAYHKQMCPNGTNAIK